MAEWNPRVPTVENEAVVEVFRYDDAIRNDLCFIFLEFRDA
jgi:hypothetical protein